MSTRDTLFWILVIAVFPPTIFLFIIWLLLDSTESNFESYEEDYEE